jgi:sugar transferase (PEP-CTERM/EpsH1 system associated)
VSAGWHHTHGVRAIVGARPLIVHIIQHLSMGGLENGLVNIINHTPLGRYRHAIVCLSHYSEFRERLIDRTVPVIALGRRPGTDPISYLRLWRLLRALSPDIVHTRNLGALDSVVVARAAGVPIRVHGEHGWDMHDLHGRNRKYNVYRRACRPFVSKYIAVSADMKRWLQDTVGVPEGRVLHICNGVDTAKFRPARDARGVLPPGFATPQAIIIGTVSRLQPVKDQVTLARAFCALLHARPELHEHARLVIVGDGPAAGEIRKLIDAAGLGGFVWMPGARPDVADLMRAMDVFVLPSLNEGISNTILEAMASGLPVVATRVGGNPELVDEGRTGELCAPRDVEALARALECYVTDADRRRAHSEAARRRAVERFSLERMVERYLDTYDELLGRPRPAMALS